MIQKLNISQLNQVEFLKIHSKNIVEKNIKIFDLSGKQIYNSNGIEQINIPFPAGIYIIKITENGKTTSKKLIVK